MGTYHSVKHNVFLNRDGQPRRP